ncbi:MAG: NAD(P)-binding protein [Proteobacteria bacterium]|jgi:NADPH-dependent glutamate synthase beta subunit-like oxidoreductase|nr:NAD(P)-binding protein [Pseudomonadota bacterium]MCG6934316.1 NAD(P)-binding protein [Pseudomonadota bacterium]
MATSRDDMQDEKLTYRRYKDGDQEWGSWTNKIFKEDTSHKCPVYVQRTPPCQGSCPSGEDIRGWLDIVRGIEKPAEGMTMQEYAFRRSTDANPFPSVMGRVCPAPCEDGCNRNEVDDFVGINSVEQYIGDSALEAGFTFEIGADTGKKIAVIGGGPAGLAGAYQLRRKGHSVTLFDNHETLGGMMKYGIPGYRTPRNVLDGEINRIIDMGVEVKLKTWVGKDVSVEQLEKDFDAILWTVGAQAGRQLPIPGAEDAPNALTGVDFLEAFNDGRLQLVTEKVVVIGGGDTSIDVASVARRLGHIQNVADKDRPENVVLGHTAHDVASSAVRQGAEVMLLSRSPIEKMPAAEHEREDALREGVQIVGCITPVEVILGDNGRAKALRVQKLEEDGKTPIEGSEYEIELDLLVSAIGQGGKLDGFEEIGNERGLIDADQHYQVPGKPGHFVAGDIVRPHLLTTAIGQASIAVESIEHYLKHEELGKRPKVDKHQFNLLQKLRETGLDPAEYDHSSLWGTSDADFAVHNFEDRSKQEIIPADKLFLGHFSYTARKKREEDVPTMDEVLGHFQERMSGLPEEEAVAEADRCMSCGMCFECDNCVIYCPQDAVYRVKKDQQTMGRYVATDYSKCIGCHICADVCPTGYIDMAMGE